MNKIEARTIRKKDNIIDTAIDLYLESGLKKVTMDEIAKASNVSKMTIYKYFGDRDHFYDRVGSTLLSFYYEWLETVYKSEKELTSRMIDFTTFQTEFILKGYLSLILELSKFNEHVSTYYNEIENKIRTITKKFVHEGKDAGLIYEDVSDEVIATYIDMGLSYFQHNEIYRHKIEEDNKFRSKYMNFIWGNIFKDSGAFTA